MKINNKQMKAAQALAAQLREEASESCTIRENLMNSLNMRTEDIDAEDILDRLNTGIRQFHTLYEKAEHQDAGTVIRGEMDNLLSQLPQEQQTALLQGLAQTFSGMTDQEMAAPEMQDNEMLKEKVCTYISEYGLAHLDAQAFEMLSGLDEETVMRMLDSTTRAEDEQYTALAAYLLTITGEWEDVPNDTTPEMIGASVAAASVVQSSWLDVLRGKIDMEQLKRILKIVAGILMIALIITIVANCLEIAALGFWTGRLYILLDMNLLFKGAMLILSSAAISAASLLVGGYAIRDVAMRSGICQAVCELADKIRSFIEEKIAPAATRFWDGLKAKTSHLRNKVHAAAGEAETVEETIASEEILQEDFEELAYI